MTIQKKTAEPPIEIDDGWWESVLAEEERYKTPVSPRPPKTAERSAAPSETKSRRAEADAAKGWNGGRPPENSTAAIGSAEKPPVDWDRVLNLYHGDQIATLTVTGCNRGGLLVEGGGLFGFVPFSHLVELVGTEPLDRDKALGAYVGRSLSLKVIECAPDDGRVVFSERAAQAEPGQRSKLFGSLQPGQKVTGLITNITDFGVFIDLGGVEGLIHISELSWGRVAHPSRVVSLGASVEALVMDIAAERCRVALSLKRLSDNPWLVVQRDYAVDQIVPATITAVLSYGAFAKLDIGVEGLIHLSEIPLESGRAIKDALNEGQRLDVRILHVDAPRQRLGLSLHLHPEPV